MQVNGMGMQGMHQYMYGASNAKGNSQMKEIMQSLSPEDRQTIRTQLQSLSPQDRQNYVSQITQLDYQNMSSSELASSIMDILGTSTQTTSSTTSNLSIYA